MRRLEALAIFFLAHLDLVAAIAKLSNGLLRSEQLATISQAGLSHHNSAMRELMNLEQDKPNEWTAIQLPPKASTPDSFLLEAEPISGSDIMCKQQISKPDWHWNLPRPAAVQEATSSMPAVDGDVACKHLGTEVDKQFDRLVSQEDAVWAWTVANQDYGASIADWALQVHSIGAQRSLVISIDPEPQWVFTLCRQGIPVIDFTMQGRVNATVAEAKFKMPAHFIRHRLTNIFAEMDIFWPTTASFHLDKILKQTNGSHLVLSTTQAAGFYEINIGFWLCKHDAPASVASFFDQVLALKGWDQVAFNQVVKKAIKVKTYDGNPFPRSKTDKCDFSDEMCKVMSEVHIGLLSSLIQNGYLGIDSRRKFQDAYPAGMHVWSYDGHLKGGLGKVLIAKNAGLYFGAGCYYEQCDSGEQYVAWDGLLHEGDSARESIEVLLAAAWATNRSLIMPHVQSSSGVVGFSEAMFRVVYPKLRESNFLYNPRVPATALYPVAQLSVHEQGWASVRTVRDAGSDSTVFYKDSEGGSPSAVARMLSGLLQHKDVTSAKTLLISVGLRGAGYYLPSFDSASCGGSLSDVVHRVKRCNKLVSERVTASDIC